MNNELYHHGIKGQKWGVRRFQNKDGSRTAAGVKHRQFVSTVNAVRNNISSSPKPLQKLPMDRNQVRGRAGLTEQEADICESLAMPLYDKAAAAEPIITKDLMATGAKFSGLENRLKQPSSLAAKIGSDAKEDNISFEEAAKGIKDTIRYTTIAESGDFVNNYVNIKSSLESKGYSEVRCKNYFSKYKNGKAMHKSVQSVFTDPNGTLFELQFQTPESQAAKDLKVPLYEERRKSGLSDSRIKELDTAMRNLAEEVPDPPGVYDDILEHKRSMNRNYYATATYGVTLSHHGIKGQKWGIRRYQNEDGSRTLLGKKRRQYYLDSTNRLRYDNDPEYRESRRKKYEKYARTNPHGYGDNWDEKTIEFTKKVNDNRVTYSKEHYLDKGKLDLTRTELQDQRRFNSTKDDEKRTARSTELVEKHQAELNRISSKAHKLAMKEGSEAAAKYVMDALGDYDYFYVHEARNHLDTGVKRVNECLTVYGKNKTYNILRESNSVSGDAAYSNYYNFGPSLTDTKRITKKL